MDWDRAEYNKEMVDYTRRAIALRRKYAAFRLSTGEAVSACVHPSVADGNIVLCDIDCDDTKNHCDRMRIIFNPSFEPREYWQDEDWHIIFDEHGHAVNESSNCIHVPALSVVVAVHEYGNEPS